MRLGAAEAASIGTSALADGNNSAYDRQQHEPENESNEPLDIVFKVADTLGKMIALRLSALFQLLVVPFLVGDEFLQVLFQLLSPKLKDVCPNELSFESGPESLETDQYLPDLARKFARSGILVPAHFSVVLLPIPLSGETFSSAPFAPRGFQTPW